MDTAAGGLSVSGHVLAELAAWSLGGFIIGVVAYAVYGYIFRERIRARILRKRGGG